MKENFKSAFDSCTNVGMRKVNDLNNYDITKYRRRAL